MKSNLDMDIDTMIQKKSVKKQDDRWIQDQLLEFASQMEYAENAVNNAYSYLKSVVQIMPNGEGYYHADARRALEGYMNDLRNIQNEIGGITDGVADSMDAFL